MKINLYVFFLVIMLSFCAYNEKNMGVHGGDLSNKNIINDIPVKIQTIPECEILSYSDTISIVSLRDSINGCEKCQVICLWNKDGDKVIDVYVDNVCIKSFKLPNNDDGYSGFSLNWLKAKSEGFEVSVEYGSRYYYSQNFIFKFSSSNFYLEKVHTTKFDKKDPENTYKEYDTKKWIDIKKIDIIKYIEEED